MERKTHSITDVMPVEAPLLEGEFEIDGAFLIHRTRASNVGDLHRADYVMKSDFGEARYQMLGQRHYVVDWGRYLFRRGLSYSARIDQAFVELHFQLEGSAQVDESMIGTTIALRAGQSNLVYVPSLSGSFTVTENSAGTVFEVLLSAEYFADLAERYPYPFGAYLERMLQGKPFWLTDDHLRITPAMWGVIQRIRQGHPAQAAGSLFLEAQILELLALQFTQRGRPVAPGGDGLSRADLARLHDARDVLLARLDDPPTLAELARCVGTNEFKLKRGFKQLFGTSPYAYLLQHRLELARTYVLDTELTIAEIAYRVGYRDPAHLTNAFRKQFGLPPSDLR